MSKSASVSWLMGVKNGMPFLPETLESIQAQTYQDFELLVWDNGSTDNTVQELGRWIPGRINGKIYTDQPLTFAESKRALVERAGSELIANIDADDVNHPERLARQVAHMESNPGLAAISCHFQRIDVEGKTVGSPDLLPLTATDALNKLLDPSPLCNPAAMMRKRMVMEVGNFRKWELAEDYDLWLRLAKRFPLGNIDFVGLKYRTRPDSMVNLAKRAGSLRRLTADVVADSGADLFGLSSSTLHELFQKNVPYALPHLVAIARHLDATQEGPPRLRSKSFLRAVRNLIPNEDFRSQAAVKALRLCATE